MAWRALSITGIQADPHKMKPWRSRLDFFDLGVRPEGFQKTWFFGIAPKRQKSKNKSNLGGPCRHVETKNMPSEYLLVSFFHHFCGWLKGMKSMTVQHFSFLMIFLFWDWNLQDQTVAVSSDWVTPRRLIVQSKSQRAFPLVTCRWCKIRAPVSLGWVATRRKIRYLWTWLTPEKTFAIKTERTDQAVLSEPCDAWQ